MVMKRDKNKGPIFPDWALNILAPQDKWVQEMQKLI